MEIEALNDQENAQADNNTVFIIMEPFLYQQDGNLVTNTLISPDNRENIISPIKDIHHAQEVANTAEYEFFKLTGHMPETYFISPTMDDSSSESSPLGPSEAELQHNETVKSIKSGSKISDIVFNRYGKPYLEGLEKCYAQVDAYAKSNPEKSIYVNSSFATPAAFYDDQTFKLIMDLLQTHSDDPEVINGIKDFFRENIPDVEKEGSIYNTYWKSVFESQDPSLQAPSLGILCSAATKNSLYNHPGYSQYLDNNKSFYSNPNVILFNASGNDGKSIIPESIMGFRTYAPESVVTQAIEFRSSQYGTANSFIVTDGASYPYGAYADDYSTPVLPFASEFGNTPIVYPYDDTKNLDANGNPLNGTSFASPTLMATIAAANEYLFEHHGIKLSYKEWSTILSSGDYEKQSQYDLHIIQEPDGTYDTYSKEDFEKMKQVQHLYHPGVYQGLVDDAQLSFDPTYLAEIAFQKYQSGELGK